jgi:hypothetical protein
MTNDSIDPIRPEEEQTPDSGNSDEGNLRSQDYVSELRETLGSEEARDVPVRKTGFFERFTKRLKPTTGIPADALKSTESLDLDDRADINTTPPKKVEEDDLTSAVSLVPTEDEIKSSVPESYQEVEFSEPAELPAVESSKTEWSETEVEVQPPSVLQGEESSQWKSFLATLWKPSETEDEQDSLDDETLASRVERSLPYESQAEKEWQKPEKYSPFVFDQDQPADEPPEGRKITGPLVFDEGEDIFSEGDGNIWGGLRQELQETEENILDEGLSDPTPVEEDIPLSSAALTDWLDLDQDEVIVESSQVIQSETDETVEEDEIEEESELPYEGRPFSDEYAHVFGEAVPEEIPPEPEPSVQEMRTIVMEDYEEPDEASVRKTGAKTSRRWLRAILVLLLGAALILLAVVFVVPALLPLQQATPEPVAAVPATTIPMEGMPYPTGIRMTGGWFFYLQPSTIREGRWEPESSEWLNGSELRRIVALPWTRQLEAVVGSIVPGDTIELHMSNGDILKYLVEETAKIDRNDVSILSSNRPSIALILFQPEEDQRWVVTANLSE